MSTAPVTTIWIAGRHKDGETRLCGAFATEAEAVLHCTTDDHFVGPLELGKAIHSEEPVVWPGLWFPQRREVKDAE